MCLILKVHSLQKCQPSKFNSWHYCVANKMVGNEGIEWQSFTNGFFDGRKWLEHPVVYWQQGRFNTTPFSSGMLFLATRKRAEQALVHASRKTKASLCHGLVVLLYPGRNVFILLRILLLVSLLSWISPSLSCTLWLLIFPFALWVNYF